MKFVGVRESKQDVVRYLNEGNEIVVMKRKKPIARLTPVQKKSAEVILLEIGRVLSEAGVSKREALKALDRARRGATGSGNRNIVLMTNDYPEIHKLRTLKFRCI